MGYAARAKQEALREGRTVLRGNPEPDPPLMMKVSDEDKVREARLRDGIARVRFSDRVYAIDSNGVLRRERPAVATFTETEAANLRP